MNSFMSNCNGGKATRGIESATEILPELLPNTYYKFAIERNVTGYTLEISGIFARNVGYKVLRYHRPFIVDNIPIWHYNVKKQKNSDGDGDSASNTGYDGIYNGQYDCDIIQEDKYGSTTWNNIWPTNSEYPDYFVIGDVYTNAYEGTASITDIKLYVPKGTSSTGSSATSTIGGGEDGTGETGSTTTEPETTGGGVDDNDVIPHLTIIKDETNNGYLLGLCEGDCDTDDDCESGLVCMDDRTNYQTVPGCVGGENDASRTDYCIINNKVVEEEAAADEDDGEKEEDQAPPASTLGDQNNCTPKLLVSHGSNPTMLLGLCEGDCDDDSQCQQGLVCKERDGNIDPNVPGCIGIDDGPTDYCVCKSSTADTDAAAGDPSDNTDDVPSSSPSLVM